MWWLQSFGGAYRTYGDLGSVAAAASAGVLCLLLFARLLLLLGTVLRLNYVVHELGTGWDRIQVMQTDL